MYRLIFPFRLLLACSLAAMGFVAANAAPASAARLPLLPFLSPAFKVCKLVPTGLLGLYERENCTENAKKGKWAWATPDEPQNTWYCVLQQGGLERYSAALCETLETNGPFETALVAGEAFPKILGLGHLSLLTGTVSGAKAAIICLHSTFTAQPKLAWLVGEAVITYTGCTSVKPAGCEVKSKGAESGTLATKSLDGTIDNPRLLLFAPEEGEAFITIEYVKKGSEECAPAGTAPEVTGAQDCTFTDEIEEPKLLHNLWCSGSGSSLKLGGATAVYEGLALLLVEGHLLWKIK